MVLWLMTSVALAGSVEIAMSSGGELTVSATEEPVYIPSCRGVIWDLFNPESGVFEPAVVPACDEMKPAIRIDKDGHQFEMDASLPPLPKVGFHVVRPVVVYGVKCAEKLPFPLSKCAEVRTQKGPQTVVRSRGSLAESAPTEPR